MNTAIITTDPVFGPWVIPTRGQTMIANNYAFDQDIKIDIVIPEPVFSNCLSTTQWSKENKSLSCAILCSIHQLPQNPDILKKFLNDMKEMEFHFCLELLSGKGKVFLSQMIEEAKIFQEAKIMNYNQVKSYKELFNLMQKQTNS